MIRYLTDLSLDAFLEAARNIPYQQIHSDRFSGVDLWIRRDDLIDPLISGNKAYKLIFNLLEAKALGLKTIVTCGGAWSNHIHATAAAGKRFGFNTIGIIRGERPLILSAMLQDAERFGMSLHFVSRKLYRDRNEEGFLSQIGIAQCDCWYIPEGGANDLGAKGVALLADVIRETGPVEFDECWVACGTGLTLGALASRLPSRIKVIGVPVLKAADCIRKSVEKRVAISGGDQDVNLIEDAHHGGYGKYNEALLKVQQEYESIWELGLDHVYTAKLMWATTNTNGRTAKRGSARYFCEPRRILLLHTGGLQGRRGMTNLLTG